MATEGWLTGSTVAQRSVVAARGTPGQRAGGGKPAQDGAAMDGHGGSPPFFLSGRHQRPVVQSVLLHAMEYTVFRFLVGPGGSACRSNGKADSRRHRQAEGHRVATRLPTLQHPRSLTKKPGVTGQGETKP